MEGIIAVFAKQVRDNNPLIRRQKLDNCLSKLTQPPSACPFKSKFTCCLSDGKQTVLLQTAQVYLFNPARPDDQIKATVIFAAKDHIVITQSAARNRLKLPEQGTKLMSIATFGTDDRTEQRCAIVQVGIRKGSFSVTVPLLSIPIIGEPNESATLV